MVVSITHVGNIRYALSTQEKLKFHTKLQLKQIKQATFVFSSNYIKETMPLFLLIDYEQSCTR